jgi:hypothetical protein
MSILLSASAVVMCHFAQDDLFPAAHAGRTKESGTVILGHLAPAHAGSAGVRREPHES